MATASRFRHLLFVALFNFIASVTKQHKFFYSLKSTFNSNLKFVALYFLFVLKFQCALESIYATFFFVCIFGSFKVLDSSLLQFSILHFPVQVL